VGRNFVERLRESLKEVGKSRIALIGFPYDVNSSFMRGPAQAPERIRQAFHSESTNRWSESGIDLKKDSILFDAGDLEVGPVDAAESAIRMAISLLLERRLTPIALGGDHSITYPIIKAFSNEFGKLNILQFDAHPDLYDEVLGNRYSHGSPFARIMDDGLVGRLVQVGIRTMTGHQREQADRFGVEVVEMRHWRDGMPIVFDSPVYISFDLDVLDPAFAPGVSHHEPGGFSTRQVIQIVQTLKCQIIGADIVEFNPTRDPLGITAMGCAKILKEIAARILTSNENIGGN
jgi:agmatinase